MIKRRHKGILLTVIVMLASVLPTNRDMADTGRQVIMPENASQLKLLRTLGQGWVEAITWSPDGKLFVVSTSRGTWIYNPADLNQPPKRLDSRGVVKAVFNADSTRLATYGKYTSVMVWDVKTWRRLEEIVIPYQNDNSGFEEVFNAAFFPSNELIITSGSEYGAGFHTWNARTGENLLDAHDYFHNRIRGAQVSPDGQFLAIFQGSITEKSNVVLWNLTTKQQIAVLEAGLTSEVNAVVFSSDGNFIASANGNIPTDFAESDVDNVAALWSVNSTQPLKILRGHTRWVTNIAYSPHSGLLASSSGDGSVRLWNTQTGALQAIYDERDGITEALAFNPVGTILAVSSGGGRISFWDIAAGRRHSQIDGFAGDRAPYIGPGGPDGNCCLTFSRDSNIITNGQFNGLISIWDANTGKAIAILRGHTSVITGVAFNTASQTVISTSWDGTLRFWSVKTGSSFFTSKFSIEKGQLPTHLRLSTDGKYIAFNIGYDYEGQNIHLYSTKSFSKIQEFQVGGGAEGAFSPDSALFAKSIFSSVELWNVKTNQKLTDLICLCVFGSNIEQLAFDTSGKRLITIHQNGGVVVYDIEKAKDIAFLNLNEKDRPHPFFLTTFNSTLTRLASLDAEDHPGQVNIWDLETQQHIASIEPENVEAILLNPSGEILATAERNGRITLWNATTGEKLTEIRSFSDQAQAISLQTFAFSPDGTLLALVGFDDVVTLYGIKSGD